MPEWVRFRCNNCGHCFEEQALTPEERRDAKRRDAPTSPIPCPKCRRTDIRRGWE